MVRILILIILAALFYYVCKRFITFMNADSDEAKARKNNTRAEEKIVKCAYCGTHIPERESMLLDHKTVCKQQPCQHSDAA